MQISGREAPGGSAYGVPYEIWISHDPERVKYEVVQGWDGSEQRFLVLGEWVNSWEDVEAALLKERFGG